MARRSRFSAAAQIVWGCLALALLPGCKQEAGSSPAIPVPEVGIMVAAAQDVPDEPEFIGQAESSRPVEIRSSSSCPNGPMPEAMSAAWPSEA